MPIASPLRTALLAVAVTAAAPTFAAAAGPQAATTPDRQVFAADWFTGAAPADAADMVRRLPGFTLVEGDDEVRGYAAAQGNVLIDGVRPASKRDDIADVLGRIPASTVERIELIRGGAGVDMAGHALLANVVRRADPPPELAIEAGVALSGDGDAWPVLEIEYGSHRGGRDLVAAFEHEAGYGDEAGRGRVELEDAAGATTGRARTDDDSVETAQLASVGWRRPWRRGTFAIDAALRRDVLAFDGRTTALDDGLDDERSREDEELRQAELALRHEHDVDGRRMTVLLSQQRGWLDASEVEEEGGDVERFDESTRTGETLASLVVGREAGDALVFNAGLELADNRLDGRARLSENGEDVPLPGSRVQVREARGEASAGLQWRAHDTTRVDAGVRVEHSRLRQEGDSPASRRFTYAKPRLAVDWQATPRQRWRASIAREVGQLDFGDFVASASLAEDQVSAGNARLEPDKRWRGELAWETRLGEDGALVVTAFHENIQDVVDRVPVAGDDGEVFDAPGNLGSGHRDGVRLELGVSLERLGLRGARVVADVLWQRSRVRDAGTGQWRAISGDKPREGAVGFEQVLADGAVTWGVDVELAEEEREYRVDERTVETEGAAWTVYGERRFGDGWRLRAELSDADGQRMDRVRDAWDGARGPGPYDEREVRAHRTPGLFLLTLRREFGG